MRAATPAYLVIEHELRRMIARRSPAIRCRPTPSFAAASA